MEAQIFKALGDPVRLKIVKRLSDGSGRTMGELTGGLGISRQGARKQVEVLVAARLLRLRTKGRTVSVTLDAGSLKKGRDFIEMLERQWDRRLLRLKRTVERD